MAVTCSGVLPSWSRVCGSPPRSRAKPASSPSSLRAAWCRAWSATLACPGGVCPPEAHDAADAYDATRYATTVGLVIGVAGGLAGGALLLAALAEQQAEPGKATEVELGLGSVRLRF